MGRSLPKRLSDIGLNIRNAMEDLGLEPAAVAAAAGISASTLYRLMRKGKGATLEPRLSTKRKLARALRKSINELFGDEQLELLEVPEGPSVPKHDELERLLLHHLQTAQEGYRTSVARAVSISLIDDILVLSGSPSPQADQEEAKAGDGNETLLLSLLHRIPSKMRRASVKKAIRAALGVQHIAGVRPSEPLYRSINRTQWATRRLKRDRPPLESKPKVERS